MSRWPDHCGTARLKINSLLSARFDLDDIVGRSRAIQSAKDFARRIADKEDTVLVTGESGTGKEMFAHALHNLSRRRNNPFIKVNCASIPLELIEAELFGYEPGAFTGASSRTKIGKFQMAEGGTLFLDEVGDMPPEMQAKLLRVIQEKEVERLGGNRPFRVDFRIIAATNKDLGQAIEQRIFRSDLYYRLNVLPLALPPLRERDEDIELLVRVFLKREARRQNASVLQISASTLACLCAYPWPGNVRELFNALTFSANRTENGTIEPSDLPLHIQNASRSGRPRASHATCLRSASEHAQREAIREALEQANGCKTRAARLLNVSRSTLYKKMAYLRVSS